MKKLLSLLLILCACIFTACSKEDNNKTAIAFQGEYVVNAEYVKSKLKDENTILVHITDKESKKTISNSVKMDYDYLTKSTVTEEGEVVKENLSSGKDFSTKLGSLGLDKNKEIIIFSDDNSGIEGKILNQLLSVGYDYAKIVDGGYDSLIKSGLEEGSSKRLKPIDLNIKDIDTSNIIDNKELNEKYEDLVVVSLDEKKETVELESEVEDESNVNNENLPNAIYLNYNKLFKKDNTLNTIKEIKKQLKDIGLKTSDNMVLHSRDGIKSSYTQLVLKMCGYKTVRCYNNSVTAVQVEEAEEETEITEDLYNENHLDDEDDNVTTNNSNNQINRPNNNRPSRPNYNRPGSSNNNNNNNNNNNTNRPDDSGDSSNDSSDDSSSNGDGSGDSGNSGSDNSGSGDESTGGLLKDSES